MTRAHISLESAHGDIPDMYVIGSYLNTLHSFVCIDIVAGKSKDIIYTDAKNRYFLTMRNYIARIMTKASFCTHETDS